MHKGINSTLDEGQTPVVQPVAYAVRTANTSANGHGVAQEVSHTLNRAQGQAIAFHPTQDPISSTDGTTHAMGCGSSGGQTSVAVALNIYGGNKRADRPEGGFYVKHEETSKTLDAASGLNPTCSQGGTAVMTAMQVRRLTPVECERLQGFPDNYTAIPWRGKPVDNCPDGPRYKALGNSWAVPVVRWIGRRIQACLL